MSKHKHISIAIIYSLTRPHVLCYIVRPFATLYELILNWFGLAQTTTFCITIHQLRAAFKLVWSNTTSSWWNSWKNKDLLHLLLLPLDPVHLEIPVNKGDKLWYYYHIVNI